MRERLSDFPQPGTLRWLVSPRDLFKEVPAEWVVGVSDGTLRLADELRNEV